MSSPEMQYQMDSWQRVDQNRTKTPSQKRTRLDESGLAHNQDQTKLEHSMGTDQVIDEHSIASLRNPSVNDSNPNNVVSPVGLASKSYALNVTGWTPLMSKAYFNEHLAAYNSTPQRTMNCAIPTNDFNDYTMGLSLTPFLTNHAGLLPLSARSTQISHAVPHLTPLHNKLVHLTDFFVDSPITDSKHLVRDFATITPSRFNMENANLSLARNESLLKRRISELDTPIKTSPMSRTFSERVKENIPQKDSPETPLKNLTKNNILVSQNPQFKTPLKQLVIQSSPLTVLLSSAIQSPREDRPNPTSPKDVGKRLSFGETEEDARKQIHLTIDRHCISRHYQSPTPVKPFIYPRLPRVPVMGLFSDRKSSSMLQPVASEKGLKDAVGNDSVPSSKMIKKGSDISKVALLSAPESSHSSTKARMQAGMNKFQIVLSNYPNGDSKRCTKRNNPRLKRTGRALFRHDNETVLCAHKMSSTSTIATALVTNLHDPSLQIAPVPLYSSQPIQLLSDFNKSINTSKDHSIFSAANNSLLRNTSIMNGSSLIDHSSFEMGGIQSTPNDKYFIDKMLEKPFPQTQLFAIITHGNSMYTDTDTSVIPPPVKQVQTHAFINHVLQNPSLSHDRQGQLSLRSHHNMVTISTPQRKDTIVLVPNVFVEEASPPGNMSREFAPYMYQGYGNISSTPQHFTSRNFPDPSPVNALTIHPIGVSPNNWHER